VELAVWIFRIIVFLLLGFPEFPFASRVCPKWPPNPINSSDSAVLAAIFKSNNLKTDSMGEYICLDPDNRIQDLSLVSLPIVGLPNQIGRLEKLIVLNISGLSLNSLPDSIVNLTLPHLEDTNPLLGGPPYCVDRGLYLSGNRLCNLAKPVENWLDKTFETDSMAGYFLCPWDSIRDWRATQNCSSFLRTGFNPPRRYQEQSITNAYLWVKSWKVSDILGRLFTPEPSEKK